MRHPLTIFHSHDLIDSVYEFSIVLKALGGLVETVAGIALLWVTPLQIQQFVATATQAELLEDPHDFLANHLLHWSLHLGHSATLFGAIYLLIHGIVKISIVAALLLQKCWAFPAAITIFSLFAVYQIYLTIDKLSIAYGLLTMYDFIIIYLIWLEYRKSRAVQTNP